MTCQVNVAPVISRIAESCKSMNNHQAKYRSAQGESFIRSHRRTGVLYLMTICSLLIISSMQPVHAQQHSYDPNTDNDGGQQFGDCLKDINKYCKAWAPLLFELENCLQSHITQLTSACRSHMENTDFRKYHRDEPLLPEF